MKETLTILAGAGNPSAFEIATKIRERLAETFDVAILSDHRLAQGGTVLLALSYEQRVPEEVIESFELSLVIHASDLPKGRGWSPANWAAENLEQAVTITLIAMSKNIDEGAIYAQTVLEFPIWMLWNELAILLRDRQVELLSDFFLGDWRATVPREQTGAATYLRRRTHLDSLIDPNLDLVSQWGKIRSSDIERFPNYFMLHGKRFKLTVERMD